MAPPGRAAGATPGQRKWAAEVGRAPPPAGSAGLSDSVRPGHSFLQAARRGARDGRTFASRIGRPLCPKMPAAPASRPRDAADWIVQNGAKDWVNDYRSIFLKEIAIDVLLSAHEHHLFPSVIFSQSILESGWGRSRLAVQYNNLFGIKGYSTDLKVRTTTYEKINGRRVAHKTSFRVFSSWGEAIQYHGDLLSTDARYQHAVQAKTYEEYIRLIAPQYASEPDYADLVVQLVEGYDLDRWDEFFIPPDGERTYQIVRDDLFGVISGILTCLCLSLVEKSASATMSEHVALVPLMFGLFILIDAPRSSIRVFIAAFF